MGRLDFALWSLTARWDKKHNQCPYCKSVLHTRLQRRLFLLEARKCHFCGLIFRWPATTAKEAEQFYEEEYSSGIVTDLPGVDELKAFRETAFSKSRFDKCYQIDWIKKFCPAPARVLNFGSSWGYTDYQVKQAGYEVEGIELSEGRAEFGRKELGLSIHTSWAEAAQTPLRRFDLIFTSHTLEHVTDLWGILDQFGKSIRANGHLIIIVPNGGGMDARTLGVRWSPFVGREHTIAFTPDWFSRNLKNHGWEPVEIVTTTPEGIYDRSCNGDGLMVISKYVGDTHNT